MPLLSLIFKTKFIQMSYGAGVFTSVHLLYGLTQRFVQRNNR
jgi:DMSO reductase anchor subunit